LEKRLYMTYKKSTLRLSALAVAATFLFSASAFADTLTVNLDSAVQTTTAGSTVSFFGTVTAPNANGETVNLNSIGETFLGSSDFTIDDSSFYNTFPFTLDPGESFSGLLFTVDVPLDASTGLYPGLVSIYGGSDVDSSDLLGSAAFEVDVPSASPVPEPASLILMMAALPGLGMMMRRKPTASLT